MSQRQRRASASGYDRACNSECLQKSRITQSFFLIRQREIDSYIITSIKIERKLVFCYSLTINSTTIYFIQLKYSNTSLLYLISFISQYVSKKQTHLHFTILIILFFEEKNSRRNSIISNYSNLSYNNYLTTKLKFKEFNIS